MPMLRVEHRAGGTAGMADSYLLYPVGKTRFHIPVEFKMRKRPSRRASLWMQLDSIYDVDLRPAQWNFGRRMVEAGVPFPIVVGHEGEGWGGVRFFMFSAVYWDDHELRTNLDQLPKKQLLLSPIDHFEEVLWDRVSSAILGEAMTVFSD